MLSYNLCNYRDDFKNFSKEIEKEKEKKKEWNKGFPTKLFQFNISYHVLSFEIREPLLTLSSYRISFRQYSSLAFLESESVNRFFSLKKVFIYIYIQFLKATFYKSCIKYFLKIFNF